MLQKVKINKEGRLENDSELPVFAIVCESKDSEGKVLKPICIHVKDYKSRADIQNEMFRIATVNQQPVNAFMLGECIKEDKRQAVFMHLNKALVLTVNDANGFFEALGKTFAEKNIGVLVEDVASKVKVSGSKGKK